MQRLRTFLAMIGAACALAAVAVVMTEARDSGSVTTRRLACSVENDPACFHSGDPHLSSAPNPDDMLPLATVPAKKTRPTVMPPRR
ncbi:hypothetical protein HNP40_000879 [Mycobacteroides chelonae]|nr:hypothetical protein [Mycobacteroides chelonae]